MTEDEQAIHQVVETWMTASRDGDVPKVLSLMTDDVVFLVPGREPFGKEAFKAASESMKGAKIDGRNDIQELVILGDWAYLRGHIEVTVTPTSGVPMRRAGHTLTILRKIDGRWLLARDANLVA